MDEKPKNYECRETTSSDNVKRKGLLYSEIEDKVLPAVVEWKLLQSQSEIQVEEEEKNFSHYYGVSCQMSILIVCYLVHMT